MAGQFEEDFMTTMPPIPEEPFCVFGTVYAHPQHADTLAEVYAVTTQLAASEPGTLYYCIARDEADPTVFHFFERYAGRAAFEEHNAQPMIKKLIEDQLIKGVKAVFAKAIEGR